MGTYRILDGSELDFFDGVNSDLSEAAGDDINYYSLNRQASKIDPLYGEFVERQTDGPWKLPAIPKWPPRTPQAGETGWTVEIAGMCTISRVHFEQFHAPYPLEGDMIEMWRTPYHDAVSMGKGLFFDVIKVLTKGHLNDTANFTTFQLTLIRRPQFGAERRITPP